MADITQVSWIDSDEVADLLRQLQGPAQPPQAGAWELHTQPLAPPAAETAPAFSLAPDPPAPPPVSDPGLPELERIREQLREIRQRAQQAGLIGAKEPAPSVEEPPPEITVAALPPVTAFHAPEADMGSRLRALCAWVGDCFQTLEAVVMNEFGDVLEGASSHVSLMLAVFMAGQSRDRSEPASALAGGAFQEQRLPNGQLVTVLPARTRYGTVALALLTSHPLPEDSRHQACAALISAVDG